MFSTIILGELMPAIIIETTKFKKSFIFFVLGGANLHRGRDAVPRGVLRERRGQPETSDGALTRLCPPQSSKSSTLELCKAITLNRRNGS